jgi:hypothetical protein
MQMAGTFIAAAAAEPAAEGSSVLHFLAQNWKKLLTLVIILGLIVYSIYFMRKRFPIVREFLVFLKERKLWWMTPIVVIFVLLAVVIVTMESSAIAPFIYALF